uniref:Presenilin n=1 Tax=Setaria digitata TaxID=48799 RepID=A0A915PZ72_9BILA
MELVMGEVAEEISAQPNMSGMDEQGTSSKQSRSQNRSMGKTDVRSGITENATQEIDDDEEESELKYGAQHVIHLFVPVSICMVFVIFTMNTVGYYSRKDGQYLIYTPFTKETDNTGEKLIMSLGNAFIILGVVVLMTVLLILLYKFRFYRGYLIMMSALMALIFIKYLPEWTVWTVLAVISIWDLIAVLCPKGPLRILVETAQERNEPIFPALIYSSGLVYAYTLIGVGMMEQSTSCATGNVKSDSDEPDASRAMPAVSSSTSTDSSVPSTAELLPTNSNTERRGFPQGTITRRFAPTRATSGTDQNATSAEFSAKECANKNSKNIERNEASTSFNKNGERSAARTTVDNTDGILQNPKIQDERGIKLGLGDFIFYSVLVGKASSYGDWNTTIACYVAILIGLCFTLILLAVFRKALPALPISVFSGLIFYFCTRGIITPFCTSLSLRHLIY